MKEQAKKMNVASLRSGDNQNTSAEAKLAKVLLLIFYINLYYSNNYQKLFGLNSIFFYFYYYEFINIIGSFNNNIIMVYGLDTIFGNKLYGYI